MAATIIRSMDAIVAKSSVQDNTILNPKAMSFPSILEVLVMLFKEYAVVHYIFVSTDSETIIDISTSLNRHLRIIRQFANFRPILAGGSSTGEQLLPSQIFAM